MAYRLKDVEYLGTNRKILLQNENGPCPLLAAANALLLKGVISLPPESIRSDVASLDDLINILADRALKSHKDETDITHHVSELMNILPLLQYGMDVNPKFTNGVTGVEYTSNLIAFDLLNIELVHGWLLDPQEQSLTLKELVSNKSYNQLIELVVKGNDASTNIDMIENQINELQKETKLSETKNSDNEEYEFVDKQKVKQGEEGKKESKMSAVPVITVEGKQENNHNTNNESNETETNAFSLQRKKEGIENEIENLRTKHHKLSHDATTGSIINNFLSSTSHQLTHYGLTELYNFISDGQFCVFFRNNHFATLTKHDGLLYLLVTDLGYANVPEVVWEKLDSIDGNTEYVDHSFVKPKPRTSDLLDTNNPSMLTPGQLLSQRSQSEADYQLALHLSGGTSSGSNNNNDKSNNNQPTLDEQEGKLVAAATEASLKDYHNEKNRQTVSNSNNFTGTKVAMPPPANSGSTNNVSTRSSSGTTASSSTEQKQEQIRKLSSMGPTVVGIPVSVENTKTNSKNNINNEKSSTLSSLTTTTTTTTQEERDRAIALQLASQIPPEEDASLLLARKLQDEENQRASAEAIRRSNHSSRNSGAATLAAETANTSSNSGRSSTSSNCIIS